MATGTVKMYRDDKGFGFFKMDDGSKDTFFHISEFRKADLDEPSEGEKYSFDIETSDKGNKAVNIDKIW